MKEKLKKNLIDRINLMQDEDKVFQVLTQLGFELRDEDFIDEMVWAKIKTLDEIEYLQDDTQSHLLSNKRTQEFATNTTGVKLFFDGEWYINRKFNLKLRPEWIDIITR